jgi:hypothetical protein
MDRLRRERQLPLYRWRHRPQGERQVGDRQHRNRSSRRRGSISGNFPCDRQRELFRPAERHDPDNRLQRPRVRRRGDGPSLLHVTGFRVFELWPDLHNHHPWLGNEHVVRMRYRVDRLFRDGLLPGNSLRDRPADQRKVGDGSLGRRRGRHRVGGDQRGNRQSSLLRAAHQHLQDQQGGLSVLLRLGSHPRRHGHFPWHGRQPLHHDHDHRKRHHRELLCVFRLRGDSKLRLVARRSRI